MTKEFEIKFEADNEGNYYTITKSEHSGFILTKWVKAKEGSKKPHSPRTLYYPNFRQIAEKVVWLNLKGHDIESILESYNKMVDTITKTLEAKL